LFKAVLSEFLIWFVGIAVCGAIGGSFGGGLALGWSVCTVYFAFRRSRNRMLWWADR
jgi:hypothetical protein